MVTLLLALHNHQPVGNLGDVFAWAFRRCYAPVLETIARYPRVHLALHYSGPLLDWIEAHEPAHLRDLERLVGAGQIEMLGGGFYEPLLAVLPARDARGQVAMMSDYWEARTGVKPRGFWLTERIWEPSLPATLSGSGLAYTLVDDTHLRYAGRQEPRFSGYYVTDKGGDPLALFPIDKQLRYLIPFTPAEDVIAHLAAQPDGMVLTYGDDGEKFGVWPNTYEWVIEKGWLARFFALLEDAGDRIHSATPGEFLATHPPSGRVYLPTASYEEMMEWSLPAALIKTYEDLRQSVEQRGELERYGPFIRGGTWDNFFVKYPESNQMHKRMLLVSTRLAATEASSAGTATWMEARRALYQSQCNCAYWHGLFGGLYVNYLRHETYAQMIRADRLLDALDGSAPIDARATDYDRDGHDEILVSTPVLCAIVKSDQGGALVELDWKPADFNVLNTISRKREAYHDALENADVAQPTDDASGGAIPSIHNLQRRVTPDIKAALVVDRHLRHSFRDHLWRPDTTLDAVARAVDTAAAEPAGAPYALGPAACTRDEWSASLTWRGRVGDATLTLGKRYEIAAGSGDVSVAYALEHDASTAQTYWFAVEFNLALLAGDAADRFYEFEHADGGRSAVDAEPRPCLASRGALEQLRAVSLVDEYFGLRLRVSSPNPFALWRFPIETVSQSESGYERSYQESALYCHWQVTLAPGSRFTPVVTLAVSGLTSGSAHPRQS